MIKKYILLAVVGVTLGILIGLVKRNFTVVASVPTFDQVENCDQVCVDWDYRWVCDKYWRGICVDWDKVKYCSNYELQCPEPVFHSACVENTCSQVEGEGENECKVDLDCLPEVTPTPEPAPEVKKEYGPVGAPQQPSCNDLGAYVPTITKVSRVDSDTVSACFTKPSDNTTGYEVWYGTSKDTLPWNTLTHDTCVTLNDVPNTHIWLKVAAKSEGCTGNFSETVDP